MVARACMTYLQFLRWPDDGAIGPGRKEFESKRGLDEILSESANNSSSWSALVLRSHTEVSARIALAHGFWGTRRTDPSLAFVPGINHTHANGGNGRDALIGYAVDCEDITGSG